MAKTQGSLPPFDLDLACRAAAQRIAERLVLPLDPVIDPAVADRFLAIRNSMVAAIDTLKLAVQFRQDTADAANALEREILEREGLADHHAEGFAESFPSPAHPERLRPGGLIGGSLETYLRADLLLCQNFGGSAEDLAAVVADLEKEMALDPVAVVAEAIYAECRAEGTTGLLGLCAAAIADGGAS